MLQNKCLRVVHPSMPEECGDREARVEQQHLLRPPKTAPPRLSNNTSCTEPHDLGNLSRILSHDLHAYYAILQDDNAPAASHLISRANTEYFTRIRPAILRGTTARQTKRRLIPIPIRQLLPSRRRPAVCYERQKWLRQRIRIFRCRAVRPQRWRVRKQP